MAEIKLIYCGEGYNQNDVEKALTSNTFHNITNGDVLWMEDGEMKMIKREGSDYITVTYSGTTPQFNNFYDKVFGVIYPKDTDNVEPVFLFGDSYVEHKGNINASYRYFLNIGEISFVDSHGPYKFILYKDYESTIPEGMFSGTSVTNCILPSTMTGIGEKAFYACLDLPSMPKPTHFITTIGDNAFANCSGLTQAVIGLNCRNIGSACFANDYNITEPKMTSIVWECNQSGETLLTTIPDYTFFKQYKLKGTTIRKMSLTTCTSEYKDFIMFPRGLKNIGDYAFQESGIVSLDLASGASTDNKISLSTGSFCQCSELTKVVLPQKSNFSGIIPNKCFQECTSLTNIDNISGVTEIGDYAFANCSGLTTGVNLSNVTKIGDDAFRNCSGLTGELNLSGATKIGNHAFENCSGLTTVKITSAETNITIGECAFNQHNFSKLTIEFESLGEEIIGNDAFSPINNDETFVLTLTKATKDTIIDNLNRVFGLNTGDSVRHEKKVEVRTSVSILELQDLEEYFGDASIFTFSRYNS